MASSGKTIIGIDLGTTNTCVALAKMTPKGTEYEALENNFGKRTTPSVVGFFDDEVVVGKIAKEAMAQHPGQVIYAVKRLFGKKFDEPEVQNLFKTAPFTIIKNDKNDPLIEVTFKGSKLNLRPEQISAYVLQEMVSIVKKKTGKVPDECIITVPAYFNELQRASTKEAAKIAGLNVRLLIPEPTAAAFAFQHFTHFDNGKVLVYDFGGGTLDTSILEVHGSKYEVKAIDGNTALGGEDIDRILMDEMISKFKEKHHDLDPTTNKRSMALLKQKCEEAKISLSSALETRVSIPSFFEGHALDETINRARLEYICDDDVITKLTDNIDTVLSDAGLESSDISYIILVGGSSHIPIVRATIEEYFGTSEKVLRAVDPDLAIAVGAATLCDKMANGLAFNDITNIKPKATPSPEPEPEPEPEPDGAIEIVDVQATSIGVLSGKNRFAKFIVRNQPLPQQKTFTFRTTQDKQTIAKVKVYLGEEEVVDEPNHTHILLHQLVIRGLPPKPKGEVTITLTLQMKLGELLSVTATYKVNGEVHTENCSIDPRTILNEDEFKEAYRMIQEYAEIKDHQNLLQESLDKLSELIAQYKTKKGDEAAKTWYQIYKNFSEINSGKLSVLQDAISKVNQTIEALKKEIH